MGPKPFSLLFAVFRCILSADKGKNQLKQMVLDQYLFKGLIFFQLYMTLRAVLCPIHVVTFTLIPNLATDYIQKRRGQALLFSFEYNLSPELISK